MEELRRASGVDSVLKVLDGCFEMGETDGGYGAWERFMKVKRPPEMTLLEYVVEFEIAVGELRRAGVTVKDSILAFVMVDHARLGPSERSAVVAACAAKFTRKNVTSCLKRMSMDGLGMDAVKKWAKLPAVKHDRVAGGEWWIAWMFFFLALGVRLWKIAHPRYIVFDELHFGRFVKRYRDGQYFFDIHPPLGKLILLIVSKWFCNDPTLDYEKPAVSYGQTDYVPLRITNAIFGSAVAPLIYAICREVGLSLPASVVPAAMQALDILVVIESRLILLEGQLMFFVALCLWCALKLWGTQKKTLRRWGYLVGTALSGAAAFSVKWTALATPGLIAIVSALGIIFPSEGRLNFDEMLVAGGTAIIFYVGMFFVHFKLLPLSGDGDAFMLIPFQQGLVGSKHYSANATRPSFINNFLWLNAEMFRANKRIDATHPHESKWYSWIISRRGLLFHHAEANGLVERMYLIVNPAVTWSNLLGLAAFMILVFAVYLPKRLNGLKGLSPKMHAAVFRGVFFIAGYVVNLLPYIAVSRCTFLYHYIPALFYGELTLANMIDLLPSRMRQYTAGVIVMLVVAAFYFWSPWIYAEPFSEWEHATRQLYGMHWE